MTVYDQLAATSSGRRALAAARLRYRVVGALCGALESAGLSQSQVAKKMGVRRSAAHQVFRSSGNLRINTVAEYLDAMGYELSITVVPVGTAREQAQHWQKLETATPPDTSRSGLESLLGARTVEAVSSFFVAEHGPVAISYDRRDYAMLQ